jgi:uncharacterized protein (DUF427 family)
MTQTPRDTVKIEPCAKRVRAYLAGQLVVDTLRPFLVWEWPYFPTYYLPAADFRADLIPAGATAHSPDLGDGVIYHVRVATASAESAAMIYPDSPVTGLRDLVHLEWKAMSEWFEEDEPVYTYPRDPYHRVDILASSRHVRVEVDGITVADSVRPQMLFETSNPPRYYLPLTDIRMDLLRPSATHSACPYKGTADFWSVEVGGQVHEDLVWIYRTPLPESQKIAGLGSFYNEKVDIYLDGVLQDRPAAFA